MTDQKDYLRLPEVLEACGWKKHLNQLGWYNDEFACVKELEIILTMQELWEGLCKAWAERWIDPLDDECEDLLKDTHPALSGMSHVVLWEPGETHFFRVSEYGSLCNAIAAAIWYALQQGKKEE